MDCRTARSLLDFARSQSAELHPDEAEALDRHLNGCSECDALFRQERHIDAHIGRAVRAVPVPSGLRQLLLDKLSLERRAKLRRLVVRGGGMAAAAAVLVVASGWGLHALLQPPRPQPDLVRVHQASASQGPTPERVKDWFQEQFAVTVEPPRQVEGGRFLDYGQLLSYGLEVPSGIPGAPRAPTLHFVACGNSTRLLQVFVLTARDFDLPNLESNLSYSSQGIKVELQPAGRDLAYLLIYPDPDGQGLEPFLIKAGPPG